MPAPKRARLPLRWSEWDQPMAVSVQLVMDASDYTWDVCHAEAREAAKGLVKALRLYGAAGNSASRIIAAHEANRAGVVIWNKYQEDI